MRILVLIITLLFVINCYSATDNRCKHKRYIVSDFDDTIKTYKKLNWASKLYYALWKKDINAGFDILLREMVDESLISKECDGNQFTVLSASNVILRRSVKKLLRHHHFPKRSIILKSGGEKTYKYKKRKIEELISEIKVPLILIGDDTSYDPIVYRDIARKFKVVTTYIHNVEDNNIYSNQKSYLTAFDIAVNEYRMGRLTEKSVLKVGNAILNSKKNRYIIPSYGHCPTRIYTFKLTDISQSISKMRAKIGRKIMKICRTR